MQTAFHTYCRALQTVAASWNDLVKQDLPEVNLRLAAEKLSALPAVPIQSPAGCIPAEGTSTGTN